MSCKYHPDAVVVEDYRAGDCICTECGLVVQERVIDVSQSWRSPNPINHSTTSEVPSKANTGRCSKDEEILSNMAKIEIIADRLHLPDSVIDTAKKMNSKIKKARSFSRAGSINVKKAFPAGIILLACQAEKAPRMAKEIASAAVVLLKDLRKCAKQIEIKCKNELPKLKVMSPVEFRPQFEEELNISSRRIRDKSLQIAREMHEYKFKEEPEIQAALAIYIASVAENQSKCDSVYKLIGISRRNLFNKKSAWENHKKHLITNIRSQG